MKSGLKVTVFIILATGSDRRSDVEVEQIAEPDAADDILENSELFIDCCFQDGPLETVGPLIRKSTRIWGAERAVVM